MIKVIGNDPDVVKRCTCKNCATILEYTQSDVDTHHGKDYSGGSDGYEYILCPVCWKEVILKAW